MHMIELEEIQGSTPSPITLMLDAISHFSPISDGSMISMKNGDEIMVSQSYAELEILLNTCYEWNAGE